MALTAAQKEQVYEFLGLPTVTVFGNPNNSLALILDSLTAPTEARVSALLTSITTSRTDISSAQGRLKAGKVGDIELNPKELKQRWKEDLRLCRHLGSLLGVPVADHPARTDCPEVC